MLWLVRRPEHRSWYRWQWLKRPLPAGEALARTRGLISGLKLNTVCDEALRPFFVRCGMKPLTGMAVRNYQTQAGCV